MPEPEEPSRVVEAELVEPEAPPQPLFKEGGLLARLALAFLLGVLGLAVAAVGVILTLTIVGALVGIPLIILGLVIAGAAALTALGGGSVRLASNMIKSSRRR